MSRIIVFLNLRILLLGASSMSNNIARELTSIIVPVCGQLEFTQQCLVSLKEHTRPAWELIVIDNGSTDGTAAYLAGVRDMANVPVTVVTNTTNLGFPAAINQGLRLARGEYLVLLNNDVVVTDAWLDQLIGLVNAKRGSTAEHAEGAERMTSAEGVEAGAGSRDPRTTDSAGISPPPCSGFVGGSAGFTPPSPPFKGGEPLRDQGGSPSRVAAACSPPIARSIGLVGPMSNFAAPPQLVEQVPYRDVAEMHRFARQWRDDHRKLWFTAPKLSGFCLLMMRSVYEKIGGLDERFGFGLFDDDDLAERARRAGFELAVAHDLFVHHFGSRTFQGNGIDIGKLLDENAQRFAAKWGDNGREVVQIKPWRGPVETRVSERDRATAIGASEGVCKPRDPVPRAAKVSLTMIVKNEEANLPHCLESVEGIFDEIVVVDTGSTDQTREIAREFGAKVFDFDWIDNFAAARNEALSHATGDYAFWLDADDVIEPEQRDKLVALLAGLRRPMSPPCSRIACGSAGSTPLPPAGIACGSAGSTPPDPPFTRGGKGPLGSAGREEKGVSAAAYVVRCACDPSPDGTGGDTVVDHIRLFPLRDDVRWTYRVHEQILPALRRANVPVTWTDLTVRHTGYVDKALRARKIDRDTKILKRELADRPNDPFVLFNLGAIAVERRDWNEALEYLKRSLAGSAPSDSIVRKLFALLARTHQMMGDSQGALAACAKGLELDPKDAELWFRKGMVHRQRGESAEAEKCWRLILTLKRPDQFCSVDQGIYGHLTRRNLAVLAAERGDHTGVRRLWEEVLAECPGDREALARLGRFREKTLIPSPS
jgi:glycosyltransferase involved in cell wall biosynthesis